ncbi:MAG: UDP-N-acetylmuramate dehydrogenase [Bdellovibrionales bacterium]|nr:UDP-N-acetylmuramate dehydrogenase [Bdellovibrionales bacterium]
MEIQTQVSLKQFNGWKVGGPAEYFYSPKNLSELKKCCLWGNEKKLPITVLSGGTNSLISDQGIKGLVIHLKHLQSFEINKSKDYIQILSLSGTPKYQVFKIFSELKLAPALFLCGLPGDMGGGVVMNAGVSYDVHPYEFSQIVDFIEVLSFKDHQIKIFKKEDLRWNYRSCTGWEEGIIYRVSLKWPFKEMENFHQQLRQINRKRLTSQPLNHPSCGSVFRNPQNNKAGKLIEESGLKGLQIGGAKISKKHANFIINKDSATALDIHQIICHVQKTVKDKFNIHLQPEVHYIGEWDQT